MILSLLNIWMMEYFYFLEFIRLFLVLYALYQTQTGERFIQTLRRAVLHWLPYLSVFLLNVFYRAFVFTNVAYQNVLLADLKANPLKTLLVLVQQVLSDLWLVSVRAWAQVFGSASGLRPLRRLPRGARRLELTSLGLRCARFHGRK
jgi:hypothetical protein